MPRIEPVVNRQNLPISIDLCLKKGDKQGGANSPGAAGGIYNYSYQENNTKDTKNITILFKQDTSRIWPFPKKINHDKNIAEVISGMLLKKLIGDRAATVFFAKVDKTDVLPDESGKNIYVGSVFFEGYKDLYVEAYEILGLQPPKERPKHSAFLKHKIIKEKLVNNDYHGFAEIMISSMLLRDFDLHAGNIGVIKKKGDKTAELVRIDFGGALKNPEPILRPHSVTDHMPGFGPTNHYLDYDVELRVNKNIADEMDRIAHVNLDASINEAIDEATKFYGIKPLAQFAKRLGIINVETKNQDRTEKLSAYTDGKLTSLENKSNLTEAIKHTLQNKLKKRQESLESLALEIRIDLCIKRDVNTKQWTITDDLIYLYLKNPDYFDNRIKDRKFHFRIPKHKGYNFFDRLFGFTKRRITNELIQKMTVIKNNWNLLVGVETYFAGLINQSLKTQLLTRVYAAIINGKLSNLELKIGINFIEELNSLIFQNDFCLHDPDKNKKLIQIKNNAPSGFKLILKEMIDQGEFKQIFIAHDLTLAVQTPHLRQSITSSVKNEELESLLNEYKNNPNLILAPDVRQVIDSWLKQNEANNQPSRTTTHELNNLKQQAPVKNKVRFFTPGTKPQTTSNTDKLEQAHKSYVDFLHNRLLTK